MEITKARAARGPFQKNPKRGAPSAKMPETAIRQLRNLRVPYFLKLHCIFNRHRCILMLNSAIDSYRLVGCSRRVLHFLDTVDGLPRRYMPQQITSAYWPICSEGTYIRPLFRDGVLGYHSIPPIIRTPLVILRIPILAILHFPRYAISLASYQIRGGVNLNAYLFL